MANKKISTFDEASIRETYEAEGEKLGRVNIVVLGMTGVGKTSLISKIFGKEVAKIGDDGLPTTKKLRYHKHNKYLGYWDTVGFEIGKPIDELLADIESQIAAPTYEIQRPHLIWYCIQGGGSNIHENELKMIQRLTALKIPVMVVITQAQSKGGKLGGKTETKMNLFTNNSKLKIVGSAPFPVCIKKESDAGMHQEFGLKELVDASFQELVGTDVADTFVTAQVVDLDLKDQSALKTIELATAAATAVGATPIPFSDAAILMPTQLAMMTKIAITYNIDVNKTTLATLAATGLARSAGTSVVTSLLKLIPGVNFIAMGVSGAVAGGLTYAIGKSWQVICRKIHLGEIDESTLEVLSVMFEAGFKKNLKRIL